MFDLFRSRAKAVRYLLGALLMLVAISMVITLIPGFGTDLGSGDNVVAEIGDDVLTTFEVQRQLQAQLRGKSIPAEMRDVYIPQLVDQLITELAVAYQAERMGFTITEAELAQTIESLFPQLFEGGKFIGKDTYAAVLAQQNMSIPQFESNLRKQILLNKIQSMALEGIIVSPKDLEREYRRRNEKVRIEHVAITPAKYRSEVIVAPEEIRQYFESNHAAFRMPEKRSFRMLVIDEAEVAKSITIPEEELRRIYQSEQENYRTPERVNVRHILLKTTEKPKEEIPAIKAKAEELLKQVRQGADFADLARKHSEDPGSAASGGELGWLVRGQTVQAFEDTAFSLKPQQISDVISTEYGFHIIQVLEKQDARLTPFEQVRDQIAEERRKQVLYDRMQQLADQARAELARNPENAEQIARDLSVPLVTAERIGPGDAIPAIGRSQELHEAISPLRQGEVTPIVQVQGNKLVVAAVTEVFPARPAELSEVEPDLAVALREEKLRKLLEDRAREVAAKATALNGDLKKAAQSKGLEWKVTQPFTRTGAADGLGSAGYVEEAFTLQVGEVFGPVTLDDQRKFVCKVVEKFPADMSALAAERDDLLQRIKSEKARERNEIFMTGIRDRLIQEGKVKINQNVLNRMMTSYRGT